MLTQIRRFFNARATHHQRSRGFTLIELLVVVAIIGIIAAVLIPNLLDALQKAKQRRAMTDMQLTGTAWMSWLSDLSGAAAAGRGTTFQRTVEWSDSFEVVDQVDLVDTLVPQFANEIPPNDPWTNPYEYRVAEDPENAHFPFGVRSAGSDGTFDTDSYLQGSFIATDYEQDIVWAAGYFVRWPGGVKRPSGS